MIIGGLFLILDQWLKRVALANQSYIKYIVDPWIGWSYFKNPGIAFGIPIPQIIVIPITVAILAGAFWYLLWKEKNNSSIFGVILVISGAVSNLADRVLYSATIDYARIITSMINLADIIIISGALLVLRGEMQKRTEKNKTMFNG